MDPTDITPKDLEGITKTIRDYIESCYTGEFLRMQRALHPALAKRTLEPHHTTDNLIIRATTKTQLVENIRALQQIGYETPKDSRRMDITILDVYENIAMAKVYSSTWVDFLHLVKISDRWEIINVLWRKYSYQDAN